MKTNRIICLLLIIIFIVLFDSLTVFSKVLLEPCQPGDISDNVKNLQQKLIEISYLDNNATGNYLAQTKNAVWQFQKDYNLATSGLADKETIEILQNAKYRIIKSGISGKDVVALQDKLKELGYLDSKSTGNYLAQTQKAVQNFQKDNNIDPTGVADIETQDAIFGTITQDGGVESPMAVEDGRNEESEFISFSKKLYRGVEGETVKKVQSKLTELGFFEGPISGYYMNQTIAAIKKFQEFNGLKNNGDTDENTWNALFNNQEVVDSNSTPAPSPEPELPKYAMTVDVTNQAVLVYEKDEKGNYCKLVRKMICSTGTVANPSDVGDWVLNGRKAKWCYFPAYSSHARYWTRINKYIAFHSVIYNSVNNMALSVKSYNKLGSRASHGCVRLLVDDAKWVYDNIQTGTVVTITESLPYDEELKYSIKQAPLNKSIMWPVATPVPTEAPNYSSSNIPPLPIRKLKTGSEGIEVFWLQSKLKELGFYTGTVTGSYYVGTKKAVEKYQRENKLYPSGIADVEMQEHLYNQVLNQQTPQPVLNNLETLVPFVLPSEVLVTPVP